jgi:heterodisulfide reductase subunit A-like polyferredoxin
MKRVRRDQDAVSRRDFIKAAAVGAGAASLLTLGAQHTMVEGRTARRDTEADVVVIGAGATGVPAAIQAAEGERP